jgi:hypothetical protein
MFLSQQNYVLDLLAEFNMLRSKPKHVLLSPCTQLLSDMNSPLVDPNLYCRIVGKLILLRTTYPDLAYTISTISRYMSSPQQAHLDAHYLRKAADFGLFY